MTCPCCKEEAEYRGTNHNNEPLYTCTNDATPCYGLEWVDKGHHTIHITPQTLHLFVKACQQDSAHASSTDHTASTSVR